MLLNNFTMTLNNIKWLIKTEEQILYNVKINCKQALAVGEDEGGDKSHGGSYEEYNDRKLCHYLL